MGQIDEVIEAFNDLYPIGTELIVIDDLGKKKVRKLKSKAWVVGKDSIIALFEGISGGYSIKRIQHVQTYKMNFELGINYLVPADAHGTPISHIKNEQLYN